MQGIDISSFQGVVPWHTIPNIDFGVVKVTEGEGYVNPYWQTNAVNMHVEKKTRGFYLFSRPGLQPNTPEGEAAYFYSKVEHTLMKGDLIACDVEQTSLDSNGTSDWTFRLLSHLEHLAKFKPLLYSYPDFIQTYLKDPRLSRYLLWLAWYKDNLPRSFAQWKTIALWQRGPGKVQGLLGNVDIDIYFLSADNLQKMGKP